ncbi:MAG: hypothetical protein NTW82_09580 [Bacteroidia bacterium]|nr:hypothetical protein [Bacteroidia bacterium]
MKKRPIIFITVTALFMASCSIKDQQNMPSNDTILYSDTIQYHPVRISRSDGSILPWFSADRGKSYDTVLMLVWNFWKNMETDSNGLKYYMNHQVWKQEHDMRGLGGDQINMALSSWGLLYAYTGYSEIVENMRYISDTYLERSLSSPDDRWPFLPYPYNTDIHSGKYDGDMRNGKGITQPDKAGSFGFELVNLYRMTGERKYLDAAVRIAQILAEHIQPGNAEKSPLPFRVNAETGEAGLLFRNDFSGKAVESALYTSNWTGTMRLFEAMQELEKDEKEVYEKAFNVFYEWMKNYPLKTNKWGPFFEDIPGWSDTQTNAISFAMFILDHRDMFPSWKQDVKGIIDWTYRELGNHEYEKYKVTVMNEQTVYRVPGNRHSSRQASVELMYTELSGDTTFVSNAVRTLNWATYTVAADGRNRYIRDDIWLTDGYGDYIRHYIRAMAAMPELAPAAENHILRSTSVISFAYYSETAVAYRTFDERSSEVLRTTRKPKSVMADGKKLNKTEVMTDNSWTWDALPEGGILKISKSSGTEVVIEL